MTAAAIEALISLLANSIGPIQQIIATLQNKGTLDTQDILDALAKQKTAFDTAEKQLQADIDAAQ